VAALSALPSGEAGDDELKRLRKRLDELGAVDFFGCARVAEARAWIARLDVSPTTSPGPTRDWQGTTWVTRAGIKVDRMASAWLIRRYIDPRGKFRFVRGKSHAAAPGEARFDMFEAEFGHEGDACTFEVLVRRMALTDPGLRAIAEQVHDLDVKDGKFGRPDTAGFGVTIEAIAAANPTDEARLERVSVWLDELVGWYRAHPG
jgi:hypothetical protein